jgi:hypothetical protein
MSATTRLRTSRPVHVERAFDDARGGLPVSETTQWRKRKRGPCSDGVHFQGGLTVSVGSATEEIMSKSTLSSLSVAALAGGAILALELSPASAFTLSGPSVQLVTSGQFDKVYYRGYHGGYHGYHGGYHGGYAYRGRYGYHGGYAYRGRYGYHGGYAYRGGYGYHGGYGYRPYGYGGAAAVGAAAIGAAAVGAAVAAPHCWINRYGTQVCN